MNDFLKRFQSDIIGLLWLSTGIFLALTLFSYHPLDPSFNTVGTHLQVKNLCGLFGSYSADLLYQSLGLSAWFFVFLSARLSWLNFRKVALQKFKWQSLWVGLLIVNLASLSMLHFDEVKVGTHQLTLGGWLGLAIVQSLMRIFNAMGSAVILWTSALILMVFSTEVSLFDFVAKTMKQTKRRVSRPAYGKGMRWLLLRLWTPWGTLLRGVQHWWRAKRVEPRSLTRPLIKPEVDLEPRALFPLNEPATPITPQVLKKRMVRLKKKVVRKVAQWELPKLEILEDPPESRIRVDEREIRQKSNLLVNKLEQFNVRGEIVGVKTGPAVTLFEFKPAVDVKISKITELADDLSLALSSESVRIIAPIPGRDVVGIETSNSQRETVYLKDSIATDRFWDDGLSLPMALGKSADGDSRVVDLRKMPHLLVAGSTGSGKSVFTVSMISGLIYRHSPKTLRLILVDPKQVDLAAFEKLPHLLMPVVKDPKQAVGALKWTIKEMEKRYRSMSQFGARSIDTFNESVKGLSKDEIQHHEKYNEEVPPVESYYFEPQPYIVVVVEEFGDLMAVDKNNVEQAVIRLAQMARACGIHLVLAMQSPRKDVVTGLIKTNIPGRISFKVASKMDSRIILDESGAERLLSRGDMLFLAPGVAKPERNHGPWLSDEDVLELTSHWEDQGEPDFEAQALQFMEGVSSSGGASFGESAEEYDELYDEILSFVSGQKEVSASLLQRKFRLGYPRAARVIELMESEGVVGPAQGSKPRQVLVNELK